MDFVSIANLSITYVQINNDDSVHEPAESVREQPTQVVNFGAGRILDHPMLRSLNCGRLSSLRRHRFREPKKSYPTIQLRRVPGNDDTAGLSNEWRQ